MRNSVNAEKKRIRIEIPLITAALVLFVLFAVYSSYDNARKQPAYTSFCTADDGVSLLFDSLAVYGFDVITGFEPPQSGIIGDVQLIIEPSGFEAYEDSVLAWIEGGGRLILALDGSSLRYFSGILFDGETRYFSIGLGDILMIDSKRLTNLSLKTDRSAGLEIVKTLERWNMKTVVFNEFFHGFEKSGGSFWKDLPLAIKLIAAQFVIFAIAVILFLGKRFGTPVPYYEEDERTENEYIIALANLYRHAGVWGFATEAYYKRFIAKAARHMGVSESEVRERLPELWESHGLKRAHTASMLAESMKCENPDKKLAKSIIANINELMKVL